MNHDGKRLVIDHIGIGFSGIVTDANYSDSHRSLSPFGLKWGRGILVRGKGYLEAVTGPYGISHSQLKTDMSGTETLEGAFYFGYDVTNKTLYLEYASVKAFDFRDEGVVDAIMNSLKQGMEPFRGFVRSSEL